MRQWKALTIALVLGVPPAGAAINPNDDRGFDPEKSYQFGDIDQVNLQSGMVSIHLPIGQRYPVAGLVDYGFTLSYSSGIWDLESFGGQVRALPSRLANAGTGWMVNPGLILKPTDPSNDSSRWIYVSPDQGMHEFWSTLHSTGESDGDGAGKVDYTRDGSYLRLRRDVGGNTNIAEIDFPDGRTHKFQLDPTNSNQFRLTQMRDPFTSGGSPANWVDVTYVDDAVNGDVWTFTDKHGRNQKIYFRLAQGETDGDGTPETVQVVDRIELTKFGGGLPAVYDFQYENEGAGTWSSVRRDCKDADGPFAGFIKMPQLSSVVLPDGTSWDMAYYYDNSTSTATCRRGQIERIEYPTGGRIEYDYGRVHMPTPDGCWDPNLWESQALTVYERTFVDGVAATNPSGTWNYSYWLEEDPAQANPCEPFSTADHWAAELMVLVTQPDGFQIENYFSIWPFLQNSASGFKRSEYGLPFTRNVPPVGGDRYLSSRVLDCASTPCDVLRSEYVTYAQDGTTGGDLNGVSQNNRRLQNNRTVFEDDLVGGVPRYADTLRSGFDGVGNFRTVSLSGNFDTGNDRLTITTYNPELQTWPSTGYDLIDVTAPWILGDFDSITTSEGPGTTHKVKQEFKFNATTGFLECVRTLKQETGRSSTGDLLVKYAATSAGMIGSESYFGGDKAGQTLGTGSICDSASASAEYVINHGYLKGVRISSQYAGVSFKHLDLEVDSATSLPTSSFDSALVETQYEYDSMGRLTKIDPQQYSTNEADAWTKVTYGFSGSARQVTVERCRQNSATCTGSGLMTQDLYQFDGLGRLYREKQRRHDGNLSRRVTLRDEMGRPRRVSTWRADGGPGDEETIAATVYGSYDAFGRPLSVTLPDGKALSYDYLGTRWVGTTRSINTWGTSGTPNLEENVTSWHRFDRQGRLDRVDEQGFWNPMNPSNDGPCYTYADYGYDEGSRLISVNQYFANPANCDALNDSATQLRTFNFDDRGFLVSETHPEKGASGNGTVSYFDFDSRGHVGRREDGVTGTSRRLTYEYDAAERLRRVRNSASTILKEYTYDTATGAGAGKLHTAKRTQTVGDPLNQTVDVIETYTYEGRQGRPSTRSTLFKSGGVNGELWTFNTYYNILGGLGALDYPTCSGGNCAMGINAPTAARQFQNNLQNGWLHEIVELAPTARTWATFAYHPNLTINTVSHGSSNVVETIAAQSHSMPRPASIEVKKGANTLWASGNYVYDGAGNIKSMGTDRFRYDQVSRLIRSELRELAPDQYQDYTFDMFSNITAITTEVVGHTPSTENFPVQSASSTPTNRLAAPRVYDASGNLTAGTGTEATFDLFNMMSGYCTSGTLAACTGDEWAYVYTADDERVASYRVNNGTGTDRIFTLRDLGNRLLTRDEMRNDFAYGHFVQDYVWRGDRLVGARTYNTGTMRHFGLDHLGTIRVTTDGSGAVVANHTYHPFGAPASSTDDGEPMKFTGHERDLQTTTKGFDDVDYLHARFRSPLTGRFLSTDPIPGHPRRPQSWNQYSYVQGNPLSYTDPAGLLLKAMSDEARTDMCALVGPDCEKHLSFGDDGTVTVTATKDELAANEALSLFNDLASSELTYGAYVGDKLPTQGGFISLGGGKGELIATNVSTTPDNRIKSQQFPPAGFSGVAGVFSGLTGVASGVNGEPAHRPSALFHELAENYLRTEKLMQWEEAHPGAIERENLLRSQRPDLNQYLLGAGTYRRVIKN